MITPEDYKITNYDKEKFKKTGILDCFQDVDLFSLKLKEIPFKFGLIVGSFNISYNELTSLKNSPHTVNGSFLANDNKLTNLDFFPKHLSNHITISYNHLESLEFLNISEVMGSFYCSGNKLTSLIYGPSKVAGDFFCEHNLIEKTEGFPKLVGRTLNFGYNKLTQEDVIFIKNKFPNHEY